MTLYSIDISNNQGPNLSMQEVKNEGFAWVEAKVSEGNYFQDRTWPGYRDAANAVGLPIVGYHYAIASCSPASQVATYVGNGGGSTVMIDFEANSGTINDYWNLVNAFNAQGVTVVLSYIPHWYWSGNMGQGDLSKVPGLISSSYFGKGDAASNIYNNAGGDGGNGWNSYGGGTPVVWQFTDGALVAGSSVDANAFRGTQDDLLTLLGGLEMTPDQAAQLADIQTQLRGPGNTGWPQLGQNAAGQNLTLVDAIASLIADVNQLKGKAGL